jgi:hypothetical protein
MASLYETLATRVTDSAEERDGLADPGTTITKAVETVDNDHATAILGVLGTPSGDDPGTTITRAVETVDDDHAAALLGLLSADPKPGPGTALTATIEEVDPDRVTELTMLSSRVCD